MGASMPSAGVACAFERQMLERLANAGTDGPFDPESLTEDYEVGLRISNIGGRGIFLRMRDGNGDLVATREYFPDNLNAAVKQKARWMVGISLAGWDRMGWQGGPAEWWMRMRDRAAALSAFVLFTAYLALLLWGVLLVAGLFSDVAFARISPVIEVLLWINFGFMSWRMAMRAIFSGMAYGWVFGLGAIPRTLIANIIAMMAARRAMLLYLRSLIGRPLTWDKTQHRFPDLESQA